MEPGERFGNEIMIGICNCFLVLSHWVGGLQIGDKRVWGEASRVWSDAVKVVPEFEAMSN